MTTSTQQIQVDTVLTHIANVLSVETDDGEVEHTIYFQLVPPNKKKGILIKCLWFLDYKVIKIVRSSMVVVLQIEYT